jgi:hypothetical protein
MAALLARPRRGTPVAVATGDRAEHEEGSGGDAEADARVQVTPRQTQVYVDGYLAGVADDFDGVFQRLHVRPGGHEITLYLDGHRPVTERIYFSAGRTQKIKASMVPLGAGEPVPPRPQPAPRARRTSSDT